MPAQVALARVRGSSPWKGPHEGKKNTAGFWAEAGGGDEDYYKSEFRAYWIQEEGGFASSSDAATNSRTVTWEDSSTTPPTVHNAATGFSNLRQEEIFWHLVDAGYEYVPENYTTDPAFKAMVDAYDQPVGGNLVDSVRIQTVSEAIQSCNNTMTDEDSAVQDLYTAAEALDSLDRTFLGDETESAIFWNQASGSLSADVLDTLRNIVQYGTRHPPGDYNLPAENGMAYA